jgi:hypothetical protein
MDERTQAENQAMLDDQEDFTALSSKLISDLIHGESDTGHLPDVKIRFRLAGASRIILESWSSPSPF